MKGPMFWLLAFFEVSMLIAGFKFLHTASGSASYIPEAARIPALVSGSLCVLLAAGVLVLFLLSSWSQNNRN